MQGQRGSSVCFMSLEDDIVVHWQQGPLGRQVDRVWKKEGEVLIDNMISKVITGIQKDKEQNHFLARKRALEYDNVMDKQREVVYRRRNHALTHQRLAFDTMYAIYNTIQAIVPANVVEQEEKTIAQLVELGLKEADIKDVLKSSYKPKVIKKLYHLARAKQKKQEDTLAKLLYEGVQKMKEEQQEEVEHAIIPIECAGQILRVDMNMADIIATKGRCIILAVQSSITLSTIDKLWTEHLEHMEELQDSVRTASYENKDPLLVFKIEGVAVFKSFLFNINKNIAKKVLNFRLLQDKIALQEQGLIPASMSSELKAEHENPDEQGEKIAVAQAPVVENTINRNERITVRYPDGTRKSRVKFKTVASDIEEGKCVIVLDEEA